MDLFSYPTKIIVSCEHGGNHIPARYRSLFQKHPTILSSHRGYDQGALPLAKALSKIIADFSLLSETSRLLVDLNRSLYHPQLFSSFTKDCDGETKKTILAQHYFPYRTTIYNKIAYYLAHENRVLHLSIHSFTPRLAGKIRSNEVGLLYHPKHKIEKKFCHHWKKLLDIAGFAVRLNYPYLGKSDGLVQHLRHHFSKKKYVGIELETNQLLWKDNKHSKQIITDIVASLQVTIEDLKK